MRKNNSAPSVFFPNAIMAMLTLNAYQLDFHDKNLFVYATCKVYVSFQTCCLCISGTKQYIEYSIYLYHIF